MTALDKIMKKPHSYGTGLVRTVQADIQSQPIDFDWIAYKPWECNKPVSK